MLLTSGEQACFFCAARFLPYDLGRAPLDLLLESCLLREHAATSSFERQSQFLTFSTLRSRIFFSAYSDLIFVSLWYCLATLTAASLASDPELT